MDLENGEENEDGRNYEIMERWETMENSDDSFSEVNSKIFKRNNMENRRQMKNNKDNEFVE